ncbi:MAG: M23 family metallopeptidase [Bacteroidetes bacterium]|nr:M23 family metallopeptidase [Bacteroidota bacterium]
MRKSFDFWQSILWKSGSDSRIVVWKKSEEEAYQEFYPKQFYPRTIAGILLSVYTFAIFGLTLFAISHELIPNFQIRDLHRQSILTSIRLQEIADSLNQQTQYLTNLQRLLSGDPDTMLAEVITDISASATMPPNGGTWKPTSIFTRTGTPQSLINSTNNIFTDESDPALSPPSPNSLRSLQLPAMAPVQGIVARNFNAEEGHYAIDIATSEGLMIRCIGDGYVIFADWTYKGGHTIAVQHADGYISVYKHNQRLLKHVGDRVQARESIAVSGDSGEYSSGPHLHFELWNNGLAQDPSTYILGY